MQHPWLQAIVLADQREEATRTQEKVQGHLNAMAVRLGELQARDAAARRLGDRLAKAAGLEAAGAAVLNSGTPPGRGGAASALPARNLSLDEFTGLVEQARARHRRPRRPARGARGAAGADSANRKFLPSLRPIIDGWYSSNFGYRIDPFTGQQRFHEGIDFLAEAGTPIVAAASGKVVYAGYHPQYGNMVEIDHGNGLVSRYAHASKIVVKEGDLVVRGQQIADVGTTGRSTGPAPALRGAPERRAAESGALPASSQLTERDSPPRRHRGVRLVLTPCFLVPCRSKVRPP